MFSWNRQNDQFESIVMWAFPYVYAVTFESQPTTQNQLMCCLSVWLSEFHLVWFNSVWTGQCVCLQSSQAATFGIWVLVRKFGILLIAIRIRNIPAQIIHINNWNKNITLHIRLTATPRTKLTVYKNSYVKNLHKRQTEKKPSVQTFTEKKN